MYRVKCFRKVQWYDYDIGIGWQKISDGLEHGNDHCSGSSSRAKCELVAEVQRGWKRQQCWINVLFDHDPFHDSSQNRRYRYWPKSAGCCSVVSFGIRLIQACFHWTWTVDVRSDRLNSAVTGPQNADWTSPYAYCFSLGRCFRKKTSTKLHAMPCTNCCVQNHIIILTKQRYRP